MGKTFTTRVKETQKKIEESRTKAKLEAEEFEMKQREKDMEMLRKKFGLHFDEEPTKPAEQNEFLEFLKRDIVDLRKSNNILRNIIKLEDHEYNDLAEIIQF